MKQFSFSTPLSLACLTLLLACSDTAGLLQDPSEQDEINLQSADARPQGRPNGSDFGQTELTDVPAPQANATTVEQFDTTSAEDRAAASAAPQTGGEQRLGETVASLGDVTQPGFWLETPLVSEPATGRVLYPETGDTAQVELIPIDGPATGGSRISLPAMRLLNAPLTGLPTLVVFQDQ